MSAFEGRLPSQSLGQHWEFRLLWEPLCSWSSKAIDKEWYMNEDLGVLVCSPLKDGSQLVYKYAQHPTSFEVGFELNRP